jgi:hypothetical protein
VEERFGGYSDLPGLEEVYLEASFVHDVLEEPHELRFILQLALSPHHPLYEPRKTQAAYCFRTGILTFPEVRRITWHKREVQVFTDAGGAADRGGIDVLVADPRGFYHLEGDFGIVDVTSIAPRLAIMTVEPEAHAKLREQYDKWLAG